jgi:hypothetical protein
LKEQFLVLIKKYEEQFGAEKTTAVQKKLDAMKEKVMEDNEAVLEWLPLRKRDVTLETLMQKTYQQLIDDMEQEMGEGRG